MVSPLASVVDRRLRRLQSLQQICPEKLSRLCSPSSPFWPVSLPDQARAVVLTGTGIHMYILEGDELNFRQRQLKKQNDFFLYAQLFLGVLCNKNRDLSQTTYICIMYVLVLLVKSAVCPPRLSTSSSCRARVLLRSFVVGGSAIYMYIYIYIYSCRCTS
jgi:hypothetical protein